LLDNPDIVFRFDVVEILWPPDSAALCELIQDAFELSQPYIYYEKEPFSVRRAIFKRK